MAMTSPQQWISEMRKQSASRVRNIQMLQNAKPYDEDRLRAMDSSLKKVTAFNKKSKMIGAQSVAQLLYELDKLNLSKYLDEIATNICEAKLKTSDLELVVEFCAKLSTMYREFPAQLVLQFRKQMPTKKNDRVENPSKFRVDLKFFAELLLNGLFEKDGLQLLGAVLSFLVQTDKQDHVNISLLLPFCRTALFPITGIVPLSVAAQQQQPLLANDVTELLSPVFSEEQRNVVAKLLTDYWDGLVEHTNSTRQAMNKLLKHIKRQERTRGDASADDRQRCDALKVLFERLSAGAADIGDCLGRAPPEMPAEPSDDEREEAAARQLGTELSEGRASLWPDRHSRLFYESLADVAPFVPADSGGTAATEPNQQQMQLSSAQRQQQRPVTEQQQHINDSIDTVDLSCLQQQPSQQDDSGESVEQQQEEEAVAAETAAAAANQQHQHEAAMEPHEAIRQLNSSSPLTASTPGGSNMHELLDRLPNCINRELIDTGALDFLRHYARSKTHRKRMVQHFLQAPVDRLDLLPFYARFLATVRPAYPDLTMHVLQELLLRFRIVSGQKPTDGAARVPGKKVAEVLLALTRLDAKLHLCSFLAELCKFGILPKAEALTCLRQLLVSMRGPKVDMLCVMVENCGTFLHRSPDAHAKMSVIMQVMREKSTNVEDARQKILLENAYYAVIPPDEQAAGAQAARARLPPEYEFVRHQLATEFRISTFRRINWSDPRLAEFTLRLLCNAQRVHFDDLPRLASLVSSLADHHDWVGVRVLDDVLEFVRLSMELNMTRLQQRTICSVVYLGQLFNYNVCNTATLFKTLYQLITFGIVPCHAVDGPDHLVVRLQRIRLVLTLVDTVCEFFVSGKSKRRMDHFLCFFLRFYHETREAWSAHVEALDEFPEDVENLLDALLCTWRRGEHFPKGLAEAHERVAEVEQFYKAKVEELMASMRSAAARAAAAAAKAEEGEERRRLGQILEEDGDEDEQRREGHEAEDDSLSDDDEDEEESDEDEEEDEAEDEEGDSSEDDQGIGASHDNDDEQHIRVHTQKQQTLPEDEDFMRDFDRLTVESLQSAPITLQGPMSDLAVPPLVRQKFERKLKFVDSDPATSHRQTAAAADGVLTPEGSSSPASPQLQEAPRMALMLRAASAAKGGGAMAKSGGVQLKAVHIADEVANMDEKWRLAQEERERDRREMKKVTLAMNERMSTAEAAERRRQIQQKLFIHQQQHSPASGGDGS